MRGTFREADRLRRWGIYATFALLLVLTRLWFLKLEVLDWDESTYIVRASNIWDATSSRLDMWYFRPSTFTGALRLAMLLFGDSLLTVRAFGGACILIAACFTFEVCRRAFGSVVAALAVATMIAGLAAPDLQSTLTEHFVIALLAASLWLLVNWPRAAWAAFGIGCILSVAALTRMNIAYSGLAVGAYYTLFRFYRAGSASPYAAVYYVLGGALPVILLAMAYWSAGQSGYFYLFVFGILLSYAFKQKSFEQILGLQFENWLRFVSLDPIVYGLLTLLLLAGCVAMLLHLIQVGRGRATYSESTRISLLVALLGIPVLVSILTGGAPYSHYWIQLFPFTAFLVATALGYAQKSMNLVASRVIAILIIIVPTLSYGFGAALLLMEWRKLTDTHFVRQAANLIAADRLPESRVYAIQFHLVHWYLKERPISPILSHPADVVQASIMIPLTEAGLVHADEFRQILASRPRYIVKKKGPVDYLEGTTERDIFAGFLRSNYELWKTAGPVEVYRALDHSIESTPRL